MKKVFVSIIALAFSFNVTAQNEYLAAAEKYFAAADYHSASQYYEKYLSGEKPKSNTGFHPYAVSATSNRSVATNVKVNAETIQYKLAESYRLLNFPEKAAPNYRKVIDMAPGKFPLARYHYAASLRALSNFTEAEAEFNTFLKEYTVADEYTENAQRELRNLAFIRQEMGKKDLALYTVNKAPAGMNGEGGNYAPFLHNSTLYFTSTRPTASGKEKSHLNRVYQADYANGTAENITLSSLPQDKDMQQGVTALTPDGNTIFFTRWMVGEGTKTASLFSSRRTDNTWEEPMGLALNNKDANTQQPFVMPAGDYIIFSSDRAGGLGGFDLWYAPLTNGKPGAPVNMGAGINTKYDEQAPSYHAPSNTLVFSSNGRTGMGGFDFFYSKGSIGNFAEPKNFGYPVNSIKDDLYLTSQGSATNILETVLLSSDRDAACCLELFMLNKKKELKNISGTVIACDTKAPLAGVSVSFVDPNTNKVIVEKTTDASGNYSFTLDEYQLLKATATLKGYFTNSLRFNSPDDAEETVLVNEPICLNVIPEVAITVDNVYYDFNKATLQDESFPSLDKLVTLLNDNPTMEIELSAHTDSKGTDEYNMKLSDERAKSVVEYLISKGIDRSRLIAKGYGESAPVADNTNADGTDNPEGRQKNRRTEFKVLKN